MRQLAAAVKGRIRQEKTDKVRFKKHKGDESPPKGDYSSDENDHSEMEVIQFEEDNNVVEIGVTEDKNEFPSETEGSSDESDQEEGEVRESEVETEDSIEPESLPQRNCDKSDGCSPKRKVIKKLRRSVEDQVEELSSTVKAMQQLMKERGILEEFQHSSKKNDKGKNDEKRYKSGKAPEGGESESNNQVSDSETTIYQEAITRENTLEKDKQCNDDMDDPEITFKDNDKCKRMSSSSEEPIDTSDKLFDVDNFIAECADKAKNSDRRHSRECEERRQTQDEQAICESEASKARMLATPGNANFYTNPLGLNIHQATLVDKNYVVIGAILMTVLRTKY